MTISYNVLVIIIVTYKRAGTNYVLELNWALCRIRWVRNNVQSVKFNVLLTVSYIIYIAFKCNLIVCVVWVVLIDLSHYIRISHRLYSMFVITETMNAVIVNSTTAISEEDLWLLFIISLHLSVRCLTQIIV